MAGHGRGGIPAALALLIALVLALVAVGAHAAPKYPPLSGRVTDAAGILPEPVRAELTTKLAALEQQNGRQLVVATVPDLEGYDINEYSVGLGRAWGIGQKGFDTGAVLVVAPKERKIQILTGRGVNAVVTDAFAGQVIRNIIRPRAKAGDLVGGIVAGTDALIAQLSRPLDDARDQAAAAAAAEARQRAGADRQRGAGSGGGGGAVFWIILVLAFLVLPRLFGGGRRRGLGSGLGGGGLGGASAAGGLLNALPWIIMASNSRGSSSGWGGGGFGGGGSGGGDSFSGGGGSFDGGGASGDW